MKYQPEPAFEPGGAARCAVLLVNLGTPEAPSASALRRYLAEFLADPRVVEIPRLLWWPILHGVILRTRPRKSAAKYASIWMPEGSPLAFWTQRQAGLLNTALQARRPGLLVRHAMRYGEPSIARTLDTLRAEGATRILVLPLYPQYAGATTGSVSDAVFAWGRRRRRLPELRFVNEFHDDTGYVAALAERVQMHWQQHGRGERLVLSFHGLPQRSLALGDPYHGHCHKTARLLGEHLGLAPEQLLVTFQSRFGNARWLQPYTEPTLQALAAEGVRELDIVCPGFVADCLETLQEIEHEARAGFIAAGGKRLSYIACLNDQPSWINALATLAERHLSGWPTAADSDAQRPSAAQQEPALTLGASR